MGHRGRKDAGGGEGRAGGRGGGGIKGWGRGSTGEVLEIGVVGGGGRLAVPLAGSMGRGGPVGMEGTLASVGGGNPAN